MNSAPSANSYSAMKLSPAVQKSLASMKFLEPTPIQAQSIPIALMGKDVLGCAQTGTGKTAAFGIPLVESLISDQQALGLVLAPTRELALQIIEVLRKLSVNVPGVATVLLIGGASMRDQYQQLKKRPRIIVATPGRLMDHLRRKSIVLNKVKCLVLDEADRMLDMGFAPQLEEILEHLPTERQTFLFSATMPGNIKSLAKKYLVNPETITIGSASTPVEAIKHEIIRTTIHEKNNLLLDQLNAREGSILIFTKTKQKADAVTDYLQDYGFSAGRIHGDRSQGQRSAAIKAFREQKFRILVATDIAARGLDVPHIQHVINYDLPQVPEDYVHRIGRTARAGATGEAVAFVVPQDLSLWSRIARLNPAWRIPRSPYQGSERSRGEFKSDRYNRGGSGSRPSRSFDGPIRSAGGSVRSEFAKSYTKSNDEKPSYPKSADSKPAFSRSVESGSEERSERPQSRRPASSEGRGYSEGRSRTSDERPSSRPSRSFGSGESRGPRAEARGGRDERPRSFEGRDSNRSKPFEKRSRPDERPSRTESGGRFDRTKKAFGASKPETEKTSFREQRRQTKGASPRLRENLLDAMGFDSEQKINKPKKSRH